MVNLLQSAAVAKETRGEAVSQMPLMRRRFTSVRFKIGSSEEEGGLAKKKMEKEEKGYGRNGWSTDSIPINRDFGRNTNRMDYFRVTELDVYTENPIAGNVSYEGGGTSRDPGVLGGSRLEHERYNPPTNVGVGDGEVVVLEQDLDDVSDFVDECGVMAVGLCEVLWVWLALWKLV
ncbi:hypothetical protein LXL04_007251 [Taraxacum kok-saghyz]